MNKKMRINSPEQIHDYIRVTNTGIWVILSAIIIFLIGFFVWIFTGSLEISLNSLICDDGEKSYSFLTYDKFSRLRVSMPVRISDNDMTGTIIKLSRDVMQNEEIINLIGLNNFAKMGLNEQEKYFAVEIDVEKKFENSSPDMFAGDVAPVKFIIDTVKPLKFLLR